jgi:hypothetical protein
MSTQSNEPSTYPDSWDDLPGTKTQAPSPEHGNAVEQEYYLQDSDTPVKKGEHTRADFSGDRT